MLVMTITMMASTPIAGAAVHGLRGCDHSVFTRGLRERCGGT
jgi:hypothetical protein